jgi:2-polyprenyl-3-methyl-5-hydroxy-6-metoxy-1,4-benzoquinol methylase
MNDFTLLSQCLPPQGSLLHSARISICNVPESQENLSTMRAKEADWYDDFYKTVQTRMAPWYQFLMPDLISELKSDSRLIELGCGQGHILRLLTRHSPIREENIFGIDQSKVAVEFTRKLLPKANISTQDIYQMNFPANHFDVCLLMETIEHLEEPVLALQKIRNVLVPGGILYISFPNFLHLPWLAVRILAEKLNRPNWIVLQPVDKIYTTLHVTKLARQSGFEFEKGIGSNYGPPVLYPLEKEWMTKSLNALGLWRLSFHPILKFRKPK